MNRTLTLGLAAFAALVFVAAFFLQPSGTGDEQADALGLALPDLAAQVNALETLAFSDSAKTITFQRADGGWQFADTPRLPVKQARVRQYLLGLSATQLVEAKTDQPKFHAAIGLADDATRVTFGDGSGLIIGKTAARQTRFVRRIGEDQSYIADGVKPPELSRKAWADIAVPTAQKALVTKVHVNDPATPYTVMLIDGEAGLSGLKLDEELAYDGVLDSVLSAADYIDFDDVAAADSIDWSAAVESVFSGKDGSITYSIVSADDAIWLRAAPSGTFVPEAPADFAWQDWAFQINEYRKGTLLKPRAELLKDDSDEAQP